ncbi:MAG: prepilin-type N-terminal cleavage/methylation domain-containing protein, partial [Clostridia bacterium]|nr:prepilin-type N-terminal cleavage/methylation domain-containing protein [Clostridia bacterium]
MQKYSGKKGFTLAETLIVVAIIIILLAVAFVQILSYMRSLTKLQYDIYAKEIFIAAQNHLSMAESQGYLGRAGTDFGTAETAAGQAGTPQGTYYFVVRDGSAV